VYLDELFRPPTAWAACREQQIGASQTALHERHRSVTSNTTMRSSQCNHTYISSQGRLPSNQKLQFIRDGRPLPGRHTL
jgi:hypothetical protein